MTQTLIQHLTTKEAWEEALLARNYETSTRNKTLEQVGFIHCSFPDQLEEVAGFVFAQCKEELVILHLDIKSLAENGVVVRVEDGGNGQNYPHIYGPIPCNLVDVVTPAFMNSEGKLIIDGQV